MKMFLQIILLVSISFQSFGQYFTVTKVGDVSSVGMAGDVIRYTITISNTSNEAISNLTVSDPLVTDLQFVSGDNNANDILDLGEIWIYTATYTVTQDDFDGNGIDVYGNTDGDGDIDNLVTVEGNLPDGSYYLDVAFEEIELLFVPPNDGYYTVTKVGDPTIVGAGGEVITYTITVQNTGYVAVNNVVVNDPLVTDLHYVSGDDNSNNILDVSESWIYLATYTVTQSDVDDFGIDENGEPDGDGDIDNVVTVNGRNPAGDPTETDTAHEDIEIFIINPPTANIYITKEGTPATVSAAGEVITYTITINNLGALAINNIIVSDQLVNDLSFISGDNNVNNVLDVDEIWIYTATYTITQNDIDGNGIDEYGNIDGDGDIDNIVRVDGMKPDGDPIEPDTAHEDIEIETIGVDEFSDLLFKTYPNPVSEILNIELNTDISFALLSLYNLQGQLVSKNVIRNEKAVKINISNFCSGTYFLKIYTKSKIQIQKIIIK